MKWREHRRPEDSWSKLEGGRPYQARRGKQHPNELPILVTSSEMAKRGCSEQSRGATRGLSGRECSPAPVPAG